MYAFTSPYISMSYLYLSISLSLFLSNLSDLSISRSLCLSVSLSLCLSVSPSLPSSLWAGQTKPMRGSCSMAIGDMPPKLDVAAVNSPKPVCLPRPPAARPASS